MPKSISPNQADLDFTDFTYQTDTDLPTPTDQDSQPERQTREVRNAIAEGLRQARRGEFTDPATIKAIFRRAGV